MHTLTLGIILALAALLGALGFLWYGENRTAPSAPARAPGDHAASEERADFEIAPGAVADKIARGENFILLDVRRPEEYEVLHLKGARLLPVEELSAASLAKIGLGEDMKDKEIIVYCRSGIRSKTAYEIMASLGYTNVKSIAGGMIHWQEDNQPFLERGPAADTARAKTPAAEASRDAASLGSPRISFDRTFHDFGVVPQTGGVVQTTFTVQNTGSGILEIGDITTSCSCTSATISTTSIPEGASATLTVFFDPDFHKEPTEVFRRTVFIPTNDPQTPEAEVSIQVDIAEKE